MFRKLRTGLVLAGVIALLVAGCGAQDDDGGGGDSGKPATSGCEGCAAAKASDVGGWCAGCGVGHLNGEKTKCKTCFEAMKTDGKCEDCGVIYKDGKKT